MPLPSILLAILVSAGPIAVMAHGFADVGSVFTGAMMSSTVAALILLGRWRQFVVNPCDILFGAFVLCVVASLVANGFGPDRKEIYLLLISLAAYPAARALGRDTFSIPFASILGLLVAVGSIVTSIALVGQWSDKHGKPFVFGQFDAAPAQFSVLLGLLALYLASRDLNWRTTVVVSALLAVPSAIFAASIVRFSFVAIEFSLLVAFFTSPQKQRGRIAAVACVLMLAVSVGAALRFETSLKFLKVLETTLGSQLSIAAEAASIPGSEIQQPPCPQLDEDDSVLIRKQLYADAFRALQGSGLFGHGFDSFLNLSCVKGAQVHNSILQATIEFGWPAGLILALLIWIAMRKTASSLDPEMRFVFYALIFVVVLSMVYGRISRELVLFLLLGYSAGIDIKKPVGYQPICAA